MDHESYEVAQQGLLVCLLGNDHEQRLAAFLGGLRNDPHWSQRQIDDVESKIREMLGEGEAVDRDSVPINGKQRLSRREEEVLRLLARGYSGKEIGTRFKLSTKTIETYKCRAYTKLGLNGRSDLIRHAIERSWLDNPVLNNADQVERAGGGTSSAIDDSSLPTGIAAAKD
jgi:DNA-binding NarL/FixJ family response regulator